MISSSSHDGVRPLAIGAQGDRGGRLRARRVALLALVGAAAALVLGTAVALGSAALPGVNYAGGGRLHTAITFHISRHDRIDKFNFHGACASTRGSWFFNSFRERAIVVDGQGRFSLRRTEPDVKHRGGKGTPLAGEFTFTVAGRFTRAGRRVSGTLSFVSRSAAGVNCSTGSVAFRASPRAARR